MKKKFRKAVFIVTYYHPNKGDIIYLLLKRKLHWKGWEFPKGGIDNKEDLINGAIRELFEETGQKPIKLKKYKVKGKYLFPKLLPDRPNLIGQIYTLFSAELRNKKIKFDKIEHSGYKWVSYKKALSLLTFLNKRKCLKIVNKDLVKNPR